MASIKRKPGRRAKAGPAKRRTGPSRERARPVAEGAPAPAAVTALALDVIRLEPLRAEAAAALGRGERVQLFTGRSEQGGPVETLVFTPSGLAAQSSGIFVHRGEWSGGRLVTDKGHLLDVDGACFCRDCEAAGGYTVDDDE